MLQVTYHIQIDMREIFCSEVKEQGIIQKSKEEPGNYKYDYYLPINSKDELCILELWIDEHAQKLHGQTEQYEKLTILKKLYVESVQIEKFWVTNA